MLAIQYQPKADPNVSLKSPEFAWPEGQANPKSLDFKTNVLKSNKSSKPLVGTNVMGKCYHITIAKDHILAENSQNM
jgi:hypothetical protein